MGKINDPLDQVDFQYRDESDQGLATTAGIAAPLISLLTMPLVGALASIAAFGAEFMAQHRKASRVEAFQDGLRSAVGEVAGRLDAIEKKAVGPEAEEAVSLALRHALTSARLDKARRFGLVLGATLAEDAPNWQEASEFIRNIEALSDPDIRALHILWEVQQSACRTVEDQQQMSVDAIDYTPTWTGVLSHSQQAGISPDDWYSRCARLAGFGLAALVQSNQAYQGPDAMCYRLTGRAVRLLKLLGRNVDPGAYPRWRYHATNPAVIVKDEDENRALGDGWADSPNAFPKT